MAPGGVVHGSRQPRNRVGAFIALTKPRIIELLLITTVPTMVLAENGWPSTWLVILTLIGGALAAGGANTMNMFVDRDIDALMERTRHRPLVTGLVKPNEALVFAVVLEVAAFAVLWVSANFLSAVLALSATAFYIGVYTLWLKRTSQQNIVIGGAAGAVPVLVGWAAVTNSLSVVPVVLFAVIFFWTPPHFWALALYRRKDYENVGMPMLPVTHGESFTLLHISLYTIIMIGVTFMPVVSGMSGPIYLLSALILNAIFLYYVIKLYKNYSDKLSMKTFKYSIVYLSLIFSALLLDHYFKISLQF